MPAGAAYSVRDALEQAGEPLGLHLPVHGRARQAALVSWMPSSDGNGERPVAIGRRVAALRRIRRGRAAHELAVVVVHAERVDRRRDGLEVAGQDRRFEGGDRVGIDGADVLDDVGGVRAAEDRVEEPAVELSVDAAGGIDVGGVGRVDGVGDREVERDAEVRATRRGRAAPRTAWP